MDDRLLKMRSHLRFPFELVRSILRSLEEKEGWRKRDYDHQFRASIFDAGELEFDAIGKVPLDSFAVRVFLFESPLGDFDKHLLRAEKPLTVQRNGMVLEAFAAKYRLQEFCRCTLVAHRTRKEAAIGSPSDGMPRAAM